MASRYMRNMDLIHQSKLNKISIIGAGGIGSALIRAAAIKGFREFDIWDDDILEEHNLSTTAYNESCLGKLKGVAAMEVINEHNSQAKSKCHGFWEPGKPLSPKTFICPDNMEVRKAAYKEWKSMDNREFFIDMRMGALTMEIITATKQVDNFMETWLPSNDIPDEDCTAKHTIFTGNVVAGYGLNQAFNVLQNRPYRDYIWISLAPISCRFGKLIPNIIGERNNASNTDSRH